MYSNKLYTPLRYPGGKARFAPLVAEIIHKNGLTGGDYLEPYAGGAGLALVLLIDEIVERIHINDVDPAVATFWRVAVNDNSRLIDMVSNAEVTIDAWHHWRSVVQGKTSAEELERGFATLFMNRTNRSGILKGGVIGGKSQSGDYKLDARFMKDKICSRLDLIGARRESIHVYEEDAITLLKRCSQFLPPKTLVYLDPPYYVKGSGLYRNSYKHEDHLEIANFLKEGKLGRPWITSYDNAAEIRDMYTSTKSVTYGLNYTAQRRYVGDEVMFFSNEISNIPSN